MPFKKGETPAGAKVFEKGKSGNPKGKVVGTQNRATVVKKWLDTSMNWVNPLNGKTEQLTLEDQITLARIKAARDNESDTAYKQLMDSRYGAPKQEIEHSGEVEIGFDMTLLDDEDLKTLLLITSKAVNGEH